MKNNVNIFDEFDKFDSEDFQTYQNRLLLRVLETILAEKGYLKAKDIDHAYAQCWVLILQDPGLVAKNWFLLKKLGYHSVNPSKYLRMQLGDAGDQERDAVELGHNMKFYVMLRLYDQPADKRLQMIAHLRNVFTMRSEVEITSGSTFTGFFQELLIKLNAIDEVMFGDAFKLTPALESLLREVGPKIVLKIKSNLRNLSCSKTAEELESVLVLRFRRFFYLELRDFLPYMDLYFSDDGFEK